jgi:hypothetical protein
MKGRHQDFAALARKTIESYPSGLAKVDEAISLSNIVE